MFGPQHYNQIIWSNIGIGLWLVALGFSIHNWGLLNVFRIYFVPYLWFGSVHFYCINAIDRLSTGSTTGLS